MNITKNAILTSALICLLSCRARPDASETRAVETSSFKGRVAVFDVYDKGKRLTRQAPGVLVSARGVLMPGLKADETVALADSQRKGEKYIPLPAANGSVSFIGLEAAASKDLGLVPTTVNAVPPLSSQVLAPIELSPRLTTATKVFMYNEYGYVTAFARINQGVVELWGLGTPHAYSTRGAFPFWFRWIFNLPYKPDEYPLQEDDALKMLRKGGGIISMETPYNGVIVYEDTYMKQWYLKSQSQTSTVDILAFVGEDSEYLRNGNFWFRRRDLLEPIVRTTIDSAAVRQNVPRVIEEKILEYLDCYKPG